MAIPLRRADPANIIAGDRTFFITSSIAGKRNLLQSRHSARLFIDVLYHYRSQHKYSLHGFVVMPDHVHVLITVGREISIERAVPVWERGFSEVRIYDSAALAGVLEYIAQNPVKRRLAEMPSEYPYSSSHGGFDLDEVAQGLKARRKQLSGRHV